MGGRPARTRRRRSPDAQPQASPPNAAAPARFHQDPIAEAEYRNPSRVPGMRSDGRRASEGVTAGVTGLKKPSRCHTEHTPRLTLDPRRERVPRGDTQRGAAGSCLPCGSGGHGSDEDPRRPRARASPPHARQADPQARPPRGAHDPAGARASGSSSRRDVWRPRTSFTRSGSASRDSEAEAPRSLFVAGFGLGGAGVESSSPSLPRRASSAPSACSRARQSRRHRRRR